MVKRLSDLPWTIPPGLILDPYAGRKLWWKGLDTANVVFVDRHVVSPGMIKASVVNLPFHNEQFAAVFADPPHFIRRSPFSPTCRLGHFGAYPNRTAVHVEWTLAAAELHRVTKPKAIMVWKSIDGAKTHDQCVNDDDLVCLTDWWSLTDKIKQPSRVPWSSAQTVFTLWSRRDLVKNET